jgi:benzil reductase ((S)-benzoin forming)
MTIFYITGTSSGIGKALAEQVLKIEGSIIYGFSRSCNIEHANYIHTTVDLSNVDETSSINLIKHTNAYKVVLINNAGAIGEIKPIGEQADNSIIKVFNLNTITPAIITNKVLQTYKGLDISMVIINISSGAARHPIESWAPYCASKAAMDMFSQVIQAENGDRSNSIKIFSVAPGIVDTNMQQEVRASNSKDFTHYDKFVGYKNNGQLATPEVAAKKILKIVDKPHDYQNVLLDIRQH